MSDTPRVDRLFASLAPEADINERAVKLLKLARQLDRDLVSVRKQLKRIANWDVENEKVDVEIMRRLAAAALRLLEGKE